MNLDLQGIAVALFIAIAFFVLVEVGFRLGQRFKAPAIGSEQFGVIQNASLGLVALLLGFSFSLAVQRFDARRAEVVTEANAIGTAALRAELLEPAARTMVLDDLRDYADVRLAFSENGTGDIGTTESLARRSDALQARFWEAGVVAARKDPHSTTIPLVLSALNLVIDESASQQATLLAVIPQAVLFALACVVLLTAPLIGVGFARVTQRNVAAAAIFALMLGLTAAIILDLDNPQRGLITVSLKPLIQVDRALHDRAPR